MVVKIADNILSPLGFGTAENYRAVKAGRSELRHYEGVRGVAEPFVASLIDRGSVTVEGSYTFFEKMVIASIAQAVAQAGIDPASMDHSAICDAMVAKFTSMTFDGLTGASMTWGKDGTVSKLPNAVVIENGAYVGM